MTDQTAHDTADEDRRLAREWAESIESATTSVESTTNPWSDRAIAAARVLLDLLPKRPTLADMTDEERAQHITGQVDVSTPTFAGRGILVGFDALSRVTLKNAHAMILTRDWQSIVAAPKDVTPRPDLPPLEWPGDKKAAPALPEDWRLADHPDHGRVIVTRIEPDLDGKVAIAVPYQNNAARLRREWCRPEHLTYLEQGADAVPENTLTKGSVWDDAAALARACEQSGRDQITVLDHGGYVYVWDGTAEWWEGSAQPTDTPCTIIHNGKKADQ